VDRTFGFELPSDEPSGRTVDGPSVDASGVAPGEPPLGPPLHPPAAASMKETPMMIVDLVRMHPSKPKKQSIRKRPPGRLA
jgi:hypothetical protein